MHPHPKGLLERVLVTNESLSRLDSPGPFAVAVVSYELSVRSVMRE
jgi:hypothetical protein